VWSCGLAVKEAEGETSSPLGRACYALLGTRSGLVLDSPLEGGRGM